MTYETGFRSLALRSVLAAAIILLAVPWMAASGGSNDAHTVPSVDGGIGPCSVQFTVTDDHNAPVYDAKVKVHIAYGFFNARKLDLEVGTNVDGKARFNGLPNRVKQPLRFEASHGDQEGSAVYDPADGCKAEHSIVLTKPENNSGAAQPK